MDDQAKSDLTRSETPACQHALIELIASMNPGSARYVCHDCGLVIRDASEDNLLSHLRAKYAA